MHKLLQNGLYLAVGSLGAFAIWSLAPKPAYTPKAIVLPLSAPAAAVSPKTVRVLSVMPLGAQRRLAHVNVSLHYDAAHREQAEITALKKARNLAAGLGATGLAVTGMGASTMMKSLLIETVALK